MKREKILEVVSALTPEFDLEQLIEKLIFIEKVEDGLNQLDEGKTVTHAQLKEI